MVSMIWQVGNLPAAYGRIWRSTVLTPGLLLNAGQPHPHSLPALGHFSLAVCALFRSSGRLHTPHQGSPTLPKIQGTLSAQIPWMGELIALQQGTLTSNTLSDLEI